MFLTLFYIISSYIKMWQLQTIRIKLLQHISSNSCVAFYRMSSAAEEFVRCCSSLCTEPDKARISEVLFVRERGCACALKPLLDLCLTTWRAPPPNPIKIAFIPHVTPKFHGSSPDGIKPSTSIDPETKIEYLNILLECDLESEDPEEICILPETEPWKILAWRMEGSRLALALHGDISHLTNLALTFLNYDTPISRIMTVKFQGYPIHLNENECNALKQGNINGSPRHCSKYIKTLQNISENKLSIVNTPEEMCIQIPNYRNHVITETVQNNIERRMESIAEKPLNDECKMNGESIHESPKRQHLTSKKSDLKLDLNSKPACEKPYSKTVTISRMQTLQRKSHSKSSLLDEPISIKERRNKGGASCPSLPTIRPPNVLIYSESMVTRENITRTLRSVLDPDRYAIYSTGDEAMLESAGSNGAALLVAGGALTARASAALLSALLDGARVLSLCSDLLISVLPYYQTAEVRERELVSFTYENWKSVKLLHHVFCYQASPARRQFSATSNTHPNEYKGHGGHTLKVEVLAAEQTWHTPSLLQAHDDKSGGTAVFSQVHLELDAREYLGTDASSAEQARLGVLRKILSGLGMSTIPTPMSTSISSEPCYTPAYFLGTYERKLETADIVAVGCLQLVKPKEKIPDATSAITPLVLHACPEKFSTLQYFQELNTNHLGRLVVYSEILSSTQTMINECKRCHGLVLIADRQTKGTGRGGTVWLSPPGCLTFSIQIIASLQKDIIARRASLLQHLMAVSFILAIRSREGYEDIDIRIKWPNDIYYAKRIKMGGIIINTNVMGDEMIINIGFGINLNNDKPTLCLNDIIQEHNPKLALLDRETVLASTLNHLEKLYEKINSTDDFTEFYDLYYKYWLHKDQEVVVVEEDAVDGETTKCLILGIDENGYLKAVGPAGEVVLRPDGNTFDMMKGLIAPKLTT